MNSTIAYTTSTPVAEVPVAAPSPAAAMRRVAAATAAAKRIADGLARRDPLYGTWICLCLCRRCIPTKDDCGGCLYGEAHQLQFVTHARAREFYAGWGFDYDPKRGCQTW